MVQRDFSVALALYLQLYVDQILTTLENKSAPLTRVETRLTLTTVDTLLTQGKRNSQEIPI